MKRRIGPKAVTGLGGSSAPSQLRNNAPLDDVLERVAHDAVNTFPLMKEYGGCDYHLWPDSEYPVYVAFGIEPSYMYDRMEIVTIHEAKERSSIKRGYAWGPWGSDIASNWKLYGDYTYNSKFPAFVDRWHEAVSEHLFNSQYENTV